MRLVILYQLTEVSNDLSTSVLPSRLLVVHDTGRGGHDDETERTSGQQLLNPVLNLTQVDVVSWRDDTALVNSAVELNNNLAGSVVVNLLELSDVTCVKNTSAFCSRSKGLACISRLWPGTLPVSFVGEMCP